MSQLSNSTPKQQSTVYMGVTLMFLSLQCADFFCFYFNCFRKTQANYHRPGEHGTEKTRPTFYFHFTIRSLPMENITDVEVVYMDMSPVHGLINKKHRTLEERLRLFQDCFFSKNLSLQVSIFRK